MRKILRKNIVYNYTENFTVWKAYLNVDRLKPIFPFYHKKSLQEPVWIKACVDRNIYEGIQNQFLSIMTVYRIYNYMSIPVQLLIIKEPNIFMKFDDLSPRAHNVIK